MSGPLTYLSNGVLMGKMYQFRLLPVEEQAYVLAEIMRRYQIGNYLGSSAHRIQHIISLGKEILKEPLLPEEQSRLESTRFRFQHIETIKILDLCLLYWLITQDPLHKEQLQAVIQDLDSPVRVAAQLIHRNYSGML